jgi:hypothetical protein
MIMLFDEIAKPSVFLLLTRSDNVFSRDALRGSHWHVSLNARLDFRASLLPDFLDYLYHREKSTNITEARTKPPFGVIMTSFNAKASQQAKVMRKFAEKSFCNSLFSPFMKADSR